MAVRKQPRPALKDLPESGSLANKTPVFAKDSGTAQPPVTSAKFALVVPPAELTRSQSFAVP